MKSLFDETRVARKAAAGADGNFDIYNESGSTNVAIDIVGYYE